MRKNLNFRFSRRKSRMTNSILLKLDDKHKYPNTKTLEKYIKDNNLTYLSNLLENVDYKNITPLISRFPMNELRELESNVSNPNYSSLSTFWRVNFESSIKTSTQRVKFASKKIPDIDEVYIDLIPKEPSSIVQDPLSLHQTYLNDAPIGIGARNILTGEDFGNNVGLIDIEKSWNIEHEDLFENLLPDTSPKYGDNWYSLEDPDNHGTSVLGICNSVLNQVGMRGINKRLKYIKLSSYYSKDPEAYNVTEAIYAGIIMSEPGDVLLIETAYGNSADWPVECRFADQLAITLATYNGRVVVEAAGNGGGDLKDLKYQDYIFNFNHSGKSCVAFDSGAIFVGACTSNGSNNRHLDSNYGNRVNCFAWGENVATLGVGDLQNNMPEDFNSDYTAQFGGTSAAAAIVAGAALMVQEKYIRLFGTPLNSENMRAILSDTSLNTPSMPVNAKIGTMPDLNSIFNYLINLPGPV